MILEAMELERWNLHVFSQFVTSLQDGPKQQGRQSVYPGLTGGKTRGDQATAVVKISGPNSSPVRRYECSKLTDYSENLEDQSDNVMEILFCCREFIIFVKKNYYFWKSRSRPEKVRKQRLYFLYSKGLTFQSESPLFPLPIKTYLSSNKITINNVKV